MPRCDIEGTINARKSGRLQDKRSYLGTDGHWYLFGVDRSNARHELFVSCAGKCFVCGNFAPETGADGFHGEVHHRSCYCLPCIEWRCGQLVRPCHRHRTKGFQKVAERKEQAAKDFNKLYGDDNEQRK